MGLYESDHVISRAGRLVFVLTKHLDEHADIVRGERVNDDGKITGAAVELTHVCLPGYSEVIKSMGCLSATACDWPLMGRNWLSGTGPRRLLVSLLGSA